MPPGCRSYKNAVGRPVLELSTVVPISMTSHIANKGSTSPITLAMPLSPSDGTRPCRRHWFSPSCGGTTQQAAVSSLRSGKSRFSQPMLSRSSNFTFLNIVTSDETETSPKYTSLTRHAPDISVSFTTILVSSTA